MNIIVSNNKVDYPGFIKVKSLQEAEGVVGSIDFMVYHKSNESSDQKVASLTRLKDHVKTLVYIKDRDSVDQAVQMVVLGSEGKYIDDEFFLESSDELSRLISGLDEVSNIVSLGGVSVLSDFFNRYLKEGSSGFNPSYLRVVKDAVSSVITEFSRKNTEIINLSTTATELFSNSAEILHRMQDEQEKMQKTLSKLESARDNLSRGSADVRLPSVVFFPTVNYLKEKNVVRIKDMGSCIYLTSFMLGFRVYLEKIKYIRPKLIFVKPVGVQYETKYDAFPWVTQSSYQNSEGYCNPVVFTNYPTKEVMQRLLDDTDYDVFIVVDSLKTSKNHILNTKGSVVKYAVSGTGSVEKFKLSASHCFSMISRVDGCMFTVPVFTEYPRDSDQREHIYLRSCDRFYEILYTVRR